SLWAVAALNIESLSIKQRLNLFEFLAKAWPKQDEFARLSTAKVFGQLLSQSFQHVRQGLSKQVPIRLNKQSISRRTDYIKRFDNTLSQFFEFPINEIRVSALFEVARAYRDLIQELTALPAPRDLSAIEQQTYRKTLAELTEPLSHKCKELEQQAFHAATERFISPEQMTTIRQAYFASHSDKAQDLMEGWTKPQIRSLKAALLPKIEEIRNQQQGLLSAWTEAIATNRSTLLPYFLHSLPSTTLDEGARLRVRAVSLEALGQVSHALEELEQLALWDQPDICEALITYSVALLAKEKTRKYLQACADTLSQSSPELMAIAVTWAKPVLSQNLQSQLDRVAVVSERKEDK
ncbi:MAG: hypothetical protein HY537_09200, partial [Deltaproteobacteria bacterium]|nr:hypothetical protein [Deltaproteobacteria bacterium]